MKRKHFISLAIFGGAIFAYLAVGIPDYAKITKEDILTTNVAEICGRSTKEVRNVPESLKKQVVAKYGLTWPLEKGKWEIDHFCPLGIGCNNSITNLWPQPAPSFHDKDKVEAMLNNQLCKGEITQKQAFQKILNWQKTYNEEIKNKLGSAENAENYEECEEGCP